MVTRLYLVRHAHADWHPDDGRPLSFRGRTDARRVADLLTPTRPVAVYSSPARRALDTVRAVAERCQLEPVLVDDLRERELPAVAPERFQEAVRASWEDPDRAVEGGEPNRVAQARGRAALLDLASRHPGEGVVVATHGNLLALALGAFDPAYGYSFWRELTSPDVYEIVLDGDALTGVSRVWSERLPVIETGRLGLRPLSVEDDWFILELVNDPSFIRNIGDRQVRSTVDARHYIRSRAMKTYAEQGIGTHAVVLKDGGSPDRSLRPAEAGLSRAPRHRVRLPAAVLVEGLRLRVRGGGPGARPGGPGPEAGPGLHVSRQRPLCRAAHETRLPFRQGGALRRRGGPALREGSPAHPGGAAVNGLGSLAASGASGPARMGAQHWNG